MKILSQITGNKWIVGISLIAVGLLAIMGSIPLISSLGTASKWITIAFGVIAAIIGFYKLK